MEANRSPWQECLDHGRLTYPVFLLARTWWVVLQYSPDVCIFISPLSPPNVSSVGATLTLFCWLKYPKMSYGFSAHKEFVKRRDGCQGHISKWSFFLKTFFGIDSAICSRAFYGSNHSNPEPVWMMKTKSEAMRVCSPGQPCSHVAKKQVLPKNWWLYQGAQQKYLDFQYQEV